MVTLANMIENNIPKNDATEPKIEVSVEEVKNLRQELEKLETAGETMPQNPNTEEIYKYNLNTQISLNKVLNELERILLISKKSSNYLATSLIHNSKGVIGASFSFSSDLSNLNEKNKLSDEEIKFYYNNIKNNITNCLKIFGEIIQHLDYSSGKFEVKIIDIPLKKEADDVINKCKSVDASKKITLENTIDENLVIKADQIILRESLTNLCSNALKFTQDGGKISISYREDPENIFIEVTDTGVGISEENQKKILDTESGNLYTTRGVKDEKGTGIGIKLMIEMLKLVDGNISIKSAPGEGSTFTVEIPKILQN
jgi:signal transduction histidine kinase